MKGLSTTYLALSALILTVTTAIDFDIKFERFSDLECTYRIGDWDKLHNPHCKSWKKGEAFNSYLFSYLRFRDSDKIPAGAKKCHVRYYELDNCQGDYGTTAGSAFEMLGRCNELTYGGGAKSVQVVCD
ncbi:hypothetical protein LTR85_008702 [Meristemomyces frigidus]|nr:hypothetical protein LTR85_008702 [Meristemomyces frigidus]